MNRSIGRVCNKWQGAGWSPGRANGAPRLEADTSLTEKATCNDLY
jgi:hypothetical protein